jgi:hypothetical protein
VRKVPTDNGCHMNSMYRAITWTIWVIAFYYAAGCSAESGVNSEGAGGWLSKKNDGVAATPTNGEAPSSACPTDNLTQECTCQEGGQTANGRQVCNTALGWGKCECEAMPATIINKDNAAREGPTDNKGAARFDWKRTIPGLGACRAGYYEGAFDGIFNSEVMSNLTVGFFSSVPVNGDVKFNIMEKPGTSGEQFEISDGHFLGTAMKMFPFDGDFYGTLDCNTKAFTGGLRNCYYVVGEDKYAFQGIALSQYDVTINTFTNGVWSVAEPSTGACYYSPLLDIDKPYPADSEFPTPMDVQPGNKIDTNVFTLPWEYRGGLGNWTGTFVHP